MSLRPDDRSSKSGRTRSRSRSRDERPTSPSKATKSKKSARFALDDDDNDEPSRSVPGSFEPEVVAKKEVRTPKEYAEPPKTTLGLSSLAADLPPRDDDFDERYPPANDTRRFKRSSRLHDDGPTSPGGTVMPYSPTIPYDDMPVSHARSRTNSSKGPQYPDDDAFAMMPNADYSALAFGDYNPPPSSIKSSMKPSSRPQPTHSASYGMPDLPRDVPSLSRSQSYASDVRQPKMKEENPRDRQGRGTHLSVDGAPGLRAISPGGLMPDMNRLSVSGIRPDAAGLPPGSPLLEAYKGTYQSISPMPSPLMLPHDSPEDIEDIEPLDAQRPTSKDENDPSHTTTKTKSTKRRAVIYDSDADAAAIWTALDHVRTIDTEPLIRILPGLTHDQLLELRDKYRKTYKKGGEKVDMAKHIKMQTEGNFGKVCFVTASGRWKSEAYWASFWYQSRAASRELLIESLMGRSNAEIREIKKAFRDRRYDDSLTQCMRKELKPDKFRDAVLTVLEEERQEETDAWGVGWRDQDVEELRRALISVQGGESTILAVVVGRSDKHLAEVLKRYQVVYRSSFAKDALKKSENLVVSRVVPPLNLLTRRSSLTNGLGRGHCTHPQRRDQSTRQR